jgi:hypothetical protein
MLKPFLESPMLAEVHRDILFRLSRPDYILGGKREKRQ